MLLENEVQKLFQVLVSQEEAQVFLGGSHISMRVFDSSSKLSLVTPVYFGGNYIPKSVRQGITKTPPFSGSHPIKTFLTIDEEHYRIFFHFLGTTELLNNTKLTYLLEEFCSLAEEWRVYLEDHDKNDRVYIYAK